MCCARQPTSIATVASIGRAGGAAPGEDHHRQGAHKGFGDIGREIGRARAGGDQADGGLSGELRIGRGHAGGRLLVPDEKVPNLRSVIEPVRDRQDVSARNAIDGAHAFRLEHLHDSVASGRAGRDGVDAHIQQG